MRMALHETFSIPLFLFVGFFFYSFHKVSFYSFHKVQAEKLEIKAVTNRFVQKEKCYSPAVVYLVLSLYHTCISIVLLLGQNERMALDENIFLRHSLQKRLHLDRTAHFQDVTLSPA